MTQPTFRSKGASGSGTTSCVAAVPTGGDAPQVNDILLIVVESTDSTTAAGTPNTPSGWTKIFEESQGDGATNVVTLTVFGKRAGASESDVTIDGVVNHVVATMLVYRDAVTTGTAWSVGTGGGGTASTATIPGMTTPSAECLVIPIVAVTRDAGSTSTFANWTNANLSSLTEREDNTTSTGAGGGIGVADGGKAAAGGTGDTTVDMTATTHVWRAVHIALKPAGISATVGQATETDTAQTVAAKKSKAVGQATETETAQPVTKVKRRSIAQASETETAQTVRSQKAVTIGQAVETETALPVVARKSKSIGQALETGAAQPVAARKSLAIGQALESDVAQPVTKSKRLTISQASETDLAQALFRGKSVVIGQATESEIAQPVTARKRKQIGLALELDTAQPLVGSNPVVGRSSPVYETESRMEYSTETKVVYETESKRIYE